MRYKHDCDNCVYLGEYKNADLYFCNQISVKTVVARFSDYGPDYISGLDIADKDEYLHTAKQKAIEIGLLLDKDI